MITEWNWEVCNFSSLGRLSSWSRERHCMLVCFYSNSGLYCQAANHILMFVQHLSREETVQSTILHHTFTLLCFPIWQQPQLTITRWFNPLRLCMQNVQHIYLLDEKSQTCITIPLTIWDNQYYCIALADRLASFKPSLTITLGLPSFAYFSLLRLGQSPLSV